MSLEAEVDENRQNIRSDGYAMSIGEVVNLYRDREIQIRPEFQRLFRWSIDQQSRLIESILLDIPIPPIFVAQREDGVWEVVDGLQRLSTVLKFLGELRDEATGKLLEASTLVKTRYLSALDGITFDSEPYSLPNPIRLQLKRARLDFRILLRESDPKVKFELFDRLNSGGEPTSPQEVRTALLLMRAPEFHQWLDGLRNAEPFQGSLALTNRQLNEQYDLELLVRFLALDQSSNERLRSFSDIDGFLTDRILEMAEEMSSDKKEAVERRVRAVFDVIGALGPDAFRKYDEKRGRMVGAFSVSAYEAVTLGVAANLEEWLELGEPARAEELGKCVRTLWNDAEFLRNSGAGVRASSRAPRMGPVGSRVMAVRTGDN